MIRLHQRLRSLRKQHHRTLMDVASQAGISVSYLSDVERGRTLPSLEVLEQIALGYGLSIGELLVDVSIRDPEQAPF